jgi:twitching motility two-component system response regulator PilH
MSHPRWCPICRAVQPVQERPGGGPAPYQCATCGTPLGAAETGTPPRRTTILCIDDDPLVLHFYRAFLEPHGYRTLTADDGAVGLAIAERDCPDVILLDVMLRGLSGFDICRKLRAVPGLRTTPIILLTVWDNPSVPRTGREAGATLTLRKPAAAEGILTAIAQVLGHPNAPGPEEA